MEEVGVHKAIKIRLRRSNLSEPFFAKVRCLDLQGDLAAASALVLDGAANLRAMELAAKLGKNPGGGAAVYLIGPNDLDVVKIGVAADPKLRLSTLQIGNWNDLFVHGLLWFDRAAGEVERLAHLAAEEMGIAVRGEWLSADREQAAELVLKAARFAKLPCYDSGVWIENWSSRVDALAESNGVSKRLVA